MTRNALAPVAAWLGTFFYACWQLVAEQKLFLHTFLIERVGNRRVEKLPLGYRNILQLKMVLFWRQISGREHAFENARRRVHERMLARLEARGVPRGIRIPITEHRVADIEPRDFYRRHVKKGVPCVLRGFYSEALGEWDLSSLAKRFPKAVGQVLDKSTKTIQSTTLDMIAADRKTKYIPQQALLDQNPDLRDHFQIERTREYFPVMGRPSSPVVSFLILGLGSGLNANFHCEESPNWYLAVSGSKRWTLVEAEYSWLLYPAATGTGLRRFSEFLADEDGEPRDKEAYPLAEYAPRMEFELHAGDVLFFPAWMWHKTINLEEEGLGVTCRFTAPTVMSNRFFRCLQLLSPYFWKSSVQVIKALIRRDFVSLEEAGDYNEQEIQLY